MFDNGFSIENLKNESKSSLILLITFLLSERDKPKPSDKVAYGLLEEDAEILQGGDETSSSNSKVLNVRELMEYTKLGRNKAMEVGNKAMARIEIGSRVLYDRDKIDLYFTKLVPGRR